MELGRYLNPIRVARGIKRRLLPAEPRDYLERARGVIHIGANDGAERDIYAKHRLPVLWVEPIPAVFAKLQANIAHIPWHRAVQHLVTDRDDDERTLHVSNNDGQSSSILDLDQHRDIWPTVHYVADINIRSVTLPTLLQRHGLSVRNYNTLVMDTQGSELLILKGAAPILNRFRFIKAEVADFPSYKGCVQRAGLTSWLAEAGFREKEAVAFAQREAGGTYFDVLYERR